MIVRELITKLGFDVDTAAIQNFNTRIGEVKKNLNSTSGNVKQLSQDIRSAGLRMTAFVTLPILGFLGKSVVEFDKEANAIAQVEAALRSTGNAAKFTVEEISNAASELQAVTRFADEDIIGSVSSQLMAFQSIGKDIFFKAQEAILDMAARTGGDLKGTTMQVGKALADPVRGLMMLRKAGVVFSAEQEFTIKELAKQGRIVEAQSMILKELNKKFGGSALAAGEAGAGPLIRLKNVMGDLMEEFGKIMMEFLIPLVKVLKVIVAWFKNLSETTKKAIVIFLLLIAVLGPILFLIGAISGSIIAMVAAWALVKATVIAATVAMMGFNLAALLIPLLVIAAIAALILILQDLYVWINGGKSLFGEFFGSFESVKGKTLGFFTLLTEAVRLFLLPLTLAFKLLKATFELGMKLGTSSLNFVQDSARGLAETAMALQPMSSVGPMGMPLSTTSNRKTNIFDVKANISVPPGTPEQQKEALAAMGKQVIEDTLQNMLSNTANGMPVTE
jgi:hypothetical protein